MQKMREEMENKFQQILTRIDTGKLILIFSYIPDKHQTSILHALVSLANIHFFSGFNGRFFRFSKFLFIYL